jgi:hypothetical protein
LNDYMIKSLSHNDRLHVLDLIHFLLWKGRSFEDALIVHLAGEAPSGNDLLKPARVIRLGFALSVLRGAVGYATLHGISLTWLRIIERLANPPGSARDDPFEGGTE